MNKWLKCICLKGLKNTEESAEGYRRGHAEATANNEAEEEVEIGPHEALGSAESSPMSSSPYIPISECITGKPMLANDSSAIETGYCNTTLFPFPPINWANHPNRESGSTSSQSKVAPAAPPPRPPKKKSSPSFAGNPVTPIAISSESMRTTPTPSATSRTAFRYDKFQECETDLMGTYLQIDSNTIKSSRSGSNGEIKLHINPKGTLKSEKEAGLREEAGSRVEYRMIDHVKTKALNQMIQEREEQLSRTTNTIKSHSSN